MGDIGLLLVSVCSALLMGAGSVYFYHRYILRKESIDIIVDAKKNAEQFKKDKISKAKEISFNISQQIQNEMTYPGQVKVTVIREMRSINVAK